MLCMQSLTAAFVPPLSCNVQAVGKLMVSTQVQPPSASVAAANVMPATAGLARAGTGPKELNSAEAPAHPAPAPAHPAPAPAERTSSQGLQQPMGLLQRVLERNQQQKQGPGAQDASASVESAQPTLVESALSTADAGPGPLPTLAINIPSCAPSDVAGSEIGSPAGSVTGSEGGSRCVVWRYACHGCT